MGRQWIVVLVFASLMSLAQESGWQHGVIVAVTKHADSQTADPDVSNYDISLRVGSEIYVVSYTVPGSSSGVEYRVGSDLVVLVKGATLTFNDLLGNPHTVAILRKEPAPESRKR